MQGLASFDRWLTRRSPRHLGALDSSFDLLPSGPLRTCSATVQPATLSFPTRPAASRQHLLNPQGQRVAGLPRSVSPAQILRAALGLQAGDWCGVLADESRSRGLQQAWRLALSRRDAASGLQWLSEPVWAPPGQRPAALQQAAQRLAVQALWEQGWRLRDADPAAPDLH